VKGRKETMIKTRRARTVCPLQGEGCDSPCQALELVEWQAKYTSNTYAVQRLATQVAGFKCEGR